MKNKLPGLIIFISISIFPGAFISAQAPDLSIFPHMSSDEISVLKTEGHIGRLFRQGDNPRYAPISPLTSEMLSTIRSAELSFGVESIYYFTYPEKMASEEIGGLRILNTLLSVSSMEGTEYYSASRKTMRTLFTESRVIDSPEKQNILPDPRLASLPARYEIYLRQTDLTFGLNLSSAVYLQKKGTVSVYLKNLTPMKYGFITMVGPEGLSTHLLVLPLDKGCLFYGAATVNSLSFFGLERRRADSFHNRIEAMYNWFINTLIE